MSLSTESTTQSDVKVVSNTSHRIATSTFKCIAGLLAREAPAVGWAREITGSICQQESSGCRFPGYRRSQKQGSMAALAHSRVSTPLQKLPLHHNLGLTVGRPSLLRQQRPRPVHAPLAAGGSGYALFSSSDGPKASFRISGTGGAAAAGEGATPESTPAPAAAAKPAKVSKPRLPGLDSLRFFLIAYIAVGHFITLATKDAFIVKLFTQVNVWVGAFFVLSGYVAGYTATELGKYEASPRIKPEAAYTVARVAGFYPLFIFVQILFGAVFAYADNFYNGPVATFAHALMSGTLIQAWFPAHSEIWNPPTWFLSALAFAMLVMPYVLPAIASMRKKGLKALLLTLTAVSLVGKLAYSYDLNAWSILEGCCSARNHPNLLLWNVMRFNPFYCLLEVLMGVAACRLVMVDNMDEEGKTVDKPPIVESAILPVIGLVAITVARAAGFLPLNDPLTRGLLFVPLFTVLLVRLHRNTLAGAPGFAGFLGQPLLTYLGTISFPIFILHGPIGQLFYKKIIATKLWGGIMPASFFPAYLVIVLLAAAAVQKFFLENKKVQEISGNITKSITKAVTA